MKPQSALEKEFNKNGIWFYPNESFDDVDSSADRMGVQIHIDVPKDKTPVDVDYLVVGRTQRGFVMNFSDWKVIEHDDRKTLTFMAWCRLPAGTYGDSVGRQDTPDCVTSFMDICFYSGQESVPADYEFLTETKPVPGVTPGDMGWYLPSRFADALIVTLGKLNDSMLSGMMEHSLIYGPLSRSK